MNVRLLSVFVAVVAFVVYVALAPAVGWYTNRLGIQRNQSNLHSRCVDQQHSWDTLFNVIHTSYNPPKVDVSTLPIETQRALAAFAPYMAAQAEAAKKAGVKVGEDAALGQLGKRPTC